MNDEHESPFRETDAGAAGFTDEQWHRRIADLRREDERRAPQFAALWRGGQRKPQRRTHWLTAAAGAVIVLAGLFWLWAVRHSSENATVASITEWKAPTDFLLETPGRDLLRTVPVIGGWNGFEQMPGPETTPSPAGKKVLHHGGRK
jgi:hypothetical protein